MVTIRSVSFDVELHNQILRHKEEFNKKEGTCINFSQTVSKLCRKAMEVKK